MDILEPMDIILPFVEIIRKINGMNLMILLLVNAVKIVSEFVSKIFLDEKDTIFLEDKISKLEDKIKKKITHINRTFGLWVLLLYN